MYLAQILPNGTFATDTRQNLYCINRYFDIEANSSCDNSSVPVSSLLRKSNMADDAKRIEWGLRRKKMVCSNPLTFIYLWAFLRFLVVTDIDSITKNWKHTKLYIVIQGTQQSFHIRYVFGWQMNFCGVMTSLIDIFLDFNVSNYIFFIYIIKEIQARSVLGLKYVKTMCNSPSDQVLVQSMKLFAR